MAYKRSNGKLQKRKMEPAVLTMQFSTPAISASSTSVNYIDLSQVASIMNRRFYRQGINWAVGGFKIFSGVSGSVVISKLPETWVMQNSYKKSLAVWQKMNNEALAESESARPRFLDFKIFADEEHHAAGFGQNLLPFVYNKPYDGSFTVATPGEWESSKIHVPVGVGAAAATTEYELIAAGSSYPGAGVSGHDAVSLIEGYASSRALPARIDPNLPSDISDATGTDPENWMAALFSEGTTQTDDVLTDMFASNNTAPYPYENDEAGNLDTMYPGGANQLIGLQTHDVATITGTTVGGMTYIKGGTFGCGLIRIDHETGDTGGNLLIQIDLIPGNHRGYLCEPMGA